MSEDRRPQGPDHVEDVYARIADAVFALDDDWRFTFLNEEAERLLDRSQEELVGEPIWEAFPEAVGTTFQTEYERAMETQQPVAFDEYFPPLETWFEVRAYPSPTGLSVYFHDITERIERRRRLREREQALRDAYSIIADQDRSLAAKVHRLLDVARGVLGMEAGVLSRIDLDRDRYRFEAAQAPGGIAIPTAEPIEASGLPNCQHVVRTADTVAVANVPEQAPDRVPDRFGIGSYLGAPVHVDEEVYGTFCFFSRQPREEPFSDWEIAFVNLLSNWVSAELARKGHERDLERSNRRLEASTRRMERFTRAASHDMQEPARTVATHLQVLRDEYRDALGEDGLEHLDYAMQGALRMRAMVRGLLTYANVETHEPEPGPVDLDEVLADVLTRRSAALNARGGSTTVADLPEVHGDREQLVKLFENLIDNAIRYSGEEPPRIRVDAEPDDGWWIVSVRDQGIGIAEAYRERVFDLFERLEPTGEGPAAGLGLAICQRIVEGHGGDLWVESAPGEGSRFSVHLPAAGTEIEIEPPDPVERRSLLS